MMMWCPQVQPFKMLETNRTVIHYVLCPKSWWKKLDAWDFLNESNSFDTSTIAAEGEESQTSPSVPHSFSFDFHLFLLIVLCIIGLAALVCLVYSIYWLGHRQRKKQRRPLVSGLLRATRQYSYEQHYVPDPTSLFASKHKHQTGSLPGNTVAIAMSPELDGSVDGSAHSSDGSSGHYVYIQSLRNPYLNISENNSAYITPV